MISYNLYFIVLFGLILSCESKRESFEINVSVTGANEIKCNFKNTVREIVSELEIGNGYRATISKGWYKDMPNEIKFIEISIQYRVHNGDLVALRKAFSVEDLPENILDIPIRDIVTVTNDNVIFSMGKIKVVSEYPRSKTKLF